MPNFLPPRAALAHTVSTLCQQNGWTHCGSRVFSQALPWVEAGRMSISPDIAAQARLTSTQSVQYCSLLKHRRLSCVPAGCHPRAPSGGGGGPRRRAGGDCKIIYSQTRYGFFGFAAGTPGPAHGLIADRGCFFKRGGRRRRRGWTRRAGRRRRFTSGYGLSRCGHREKAGPPAAAKEDLLVFSRRSWCETARPSSLRQTLLVITQQPYFSSRQAILL